VKGKDPKTDRYFDDTKQYVDKLDFLTDATDRSSTRTTRGRSTRASTPAWKHSQGDKPTSAGCRLVIDSIIARCHLFAFTRS